MIITRFTPALALFALLCMASSALAQSAPQYDRSQLATGAAYSWDSSAGLSKAINQGFDGEVYRFLVTDRAPDGSETETLFATDQQGRLLWDLQDGETYTYQPNDCSFVVGTCNYQLIIESDVAGKLTSTAYFQDGIWFHIVDTKINGQPPYTSYVCGIYDGDSIIQALYAIDSDSDEPYWLRITSGPNAGRSRDMLAQVTDACQKARQSS